MVAILGNHRFDHHRVAGQSLFHDARPPAAPPSRSSTLSAGAFFALGHAHETARRLNSPALRFRRSRSPPSPRHSLRRCARWQAMTLVDARQIFRQRLAARMRLALSRRGCVSAVSRRASASTSSRVVPGSSSVSSSSCRSLSVSLFGPKLLNARLPQALFQRLDLPTAPSAVAFPVPLFDQSCARERSR